MTYKVQIDNVVRDATPDEAAMIEAQNDQGLALEAAAQAKAAARASALTKLAELGLTEAEVAALIGG